MGLLAGLLIIFQTILFIHFIRVSVVLALFINYFTKKTERLGSVCRSSGNYNFRNKGFQSLN